jgi:parallel beta-helix repeat protein
VTKCTFSDNTASGTYDPGGGDYGSSGGGMYNTSSSPTVTSCTFSGNTAVNDGGGMCNYDHSSPTVTDCTFSGSWASSGGGMYNKDCSPTVTDCTFSGNWADHDGGGMYNHNSSPTVTKCTFSDNTASGTYDPGGAGGGGMCNYDHSSPTVTNCTFSDNTADYGGGMCNYDHSSPTVTNCTFSDNTASDNGGGMYNKDCSPTVTNCIFWDNTAPSGAEIYNYHGGPYVTPTFRHCDIGGSGGSGASWDTALGADGGGNIGGDPRFLAPATPAGTDGLWRTSDDGLRLQPDSPCIGAADPAVAPETDILGLTRKAAPDIGAYEFPSGGYCTLTYNTGPGGSISGTTPQTVDYGTSGTAVEAVPSVGYHFVQWSDASTANPRTDTNVATDMTVTATFAVNTYTLTYNAGADGSISGTTPQTVDYGADGPEVTAVPDVGHRFVRWSDGSTANPRKDTNVTADINVNAVFAPLAAVKDWPLYE